LILDIRPHNAHAAARLPSALSLCVPSTLLKRPTFPLARLAPMLPSTAARTRFAAWRDASRIVVYDADAPALSDRPALLGLLRKFRAEGFEASKEVAWVRGGFNAIYRERPDLLDRSPIVDEDGEEEDELGDMAPPMGLTAAPSFPTCIFLLTCMRTQVAANPFFDAIRQNLELAHGAGSSGEPIVLRLPRRVRRRVGDLPFDSQSPSSAEDLTRALELQFYKIELGEQRRLMGVMEHHSKESGTQASAGGIITAGLEKGNKNRYRNIWPFEHARVRLCKSRPDDDDYMNASYVQPLGTTKRYIATQGPLPATFADFWTLCWEQNVHVVVMLTREIESNTVKCGKYWDDGEYGPLRLKLLATDDTPEQEHRRKESEMNAGFFAAHVTLPHKAKGKGKRAGKERGRANEHPSTVRRVFQLKHTGYPRAPPRIITQLQYLDWPDFNVPSDPRGVLELIHEVEEAEGNEVDPSTGIARHAQGNPPVLLHCSAGVGRTGGFIAVDAVLDGLRRDMRKRREETEAGAAAGGSASPIRRVIEDMREQRMSLCQSLRQYVFVHRAIIE
ncbi:hypothetical protein POSPLADRAFT_1108046, partial [Postia placenta MAD-698-R-SB12]